MPSLRSAATDATECKDLKPTSPILEGPYFVKDMPERSVLIDKNDPSPRLIVTGQVRNTNGEPVEARLQIWSVAPTGSYTYKAEKYWGRGMLFSSPEDGAFTFETWKPVNYGGMAQHVHYKVTAKGHQELTTQMLFSDDRQLHAKKFQTKDETTTVTAEKGKDGKFHVHYDITLKAD